MTCRLFRQTKFLKLDSVLLFWPLSIQKRSKTKKMNHCKFVHILNALVFSFLITITSHAVATESFIVKQTVGLGKYETGDPKSIVREGSRKMVEGANMLRESMRVAKQNRDKTKSREIMSRAIDLMVEGEKLIALGSKRADQIPSANSQIKPLISSCIKIMGGCKLMKQGVSNLMSGDVHSPWAEKTVAKGHKQVKDGEKKILEKENKKTD